MYTIILSVHAQPNHADIKTSWGWTAADVARRWGHCALADYVEEFQPGPRGELHCNWPSAVVHMQLSI